MQSGSTPETATSSSSTQIIFYQLPVTTSASTTSAATVTADNAPIPPSELYHPPPKKAANLLHASEFEYFHEGMDREAAEEYLKTRNDFSFIIRPSSEGEEYLAVSFKSSVLEKKADHIENKVCHFLIQPSANKDKKWVLINGDKRILIVDLVAYFSRGKKVGSWISRHEAKNQGEERMTFKPR